MTREEAIKGLKRLSYEFSGYKPNEEMFDMAIKALEQEPYDDAKYHEEHGEVIVDKAVWEDAKRALEQEPSGDAVSREAVLNELDKELYSHNAKMAIKAIPSAEPRYYPPCEDCHKKMDEIRKAYDKIQSAEPKTGHWIEHPEIKTITPEIMFYECSECGDIQCFCKSDIHKKHFCNYCGARMVEPQEISDRNLKMWHDIYEEEKRRTERSDKE